MERVMICKCIRGFLCDEGGASTILSIFWFILFVGIGGLAVDITNGFRVETMMQATADSAAHAAVIDLPDANAAVDTALAYAESNMPALLYGAVLAANDVEIGIWQPNGRVFTPGAAPPNAVRVTVRSTRATGNPVGVSFLRIIGLREWNINVAAIAAYSVSGNCLDNYGFIARGFVDSGSENNYYDVCIHGEEYVKVGSQNNFYDDTQVSMHDLGLLDDGSDNSGLHPEVPEGALFQQSYDPPMVDQVDDIITGLSGGGSLPINPPTFLTQTSHVSQLPNPLVEGTLYIVDGPDDVVIPSDAVLNNIGVVVLNDLKKLLVGSKVSLSNVLLAARNNVEVGSENQIGHSNYCNTGQGAVFIFTGAEYKAGSQTDYSGVQIVSVSHSSIGSELTSGGIGPEALSVQAGGNIYWGSKEVFRGNCSAPSFFSLDGRVAIVD